MFENDRAFCWIKIIPKVSSNVQTKKILILFRVMVCFIQPPVAWTRKLLSFFFLLLLFWKIKPVYLSQVCDLKWI